MSILIRPGAYSQRVGWMTPEKCFGSTSFPEDSSHTALTTVSWPASYVPAPGATIGPCFVQLCPPSELASTQQAHDPQVSCDVPHKMSPLLNAIGLFFAGPINPAGSIVGVDQVCPPSEDVRYIPVHVGTETPIL